ncbi:MAG TPA: VOC family protein [Pedococcus sp.]|jgi:predicted enzyme related to lactoylglutathione lyase|uniref:VOC family protein n=1 Tax=Pedococcus sp. TaxID=2860345 RepID=UPI002F92BAD4
MSQSHAALGMPRLDLVVLDCPDPRALGAFYAKVLGWSIVSADDDWVDLRGPGGGIGLSFQRVEGYQPPTWPEGPRPQHFHLDLQVPDIDAAEPAVLEAGATVHEHQPSENGGFRVYLDPAGHPFCLCRD